MIRVLEVVLGGGGMLGAFFGWLTVKWLDAREAERRLKRRAVAARPAVVPLPPGAPFPILPLDRDAGWITETLGRGIGVVLPPDPPEPGGLPPALPFTPPPPPAGVCQHVYGYHTCTLPPHHKGEHLCICFRLPGPHNFS